MLHRRQQELSPERVAEIRCTEDVWKKRMVVYIPRYAIHTDEFLKERGVPYSTSMSAETRHEWNKEMVTARMSINRQVVLYEKGIPIAYPDRLKAISVYQTIKQHVTNWKILISGSLNMRVKSPPIEDFELMLEFAENLEQYLDYYHHHLNALDFKAFQRRPMNRFAASEQYIHRPNSTWSQLREGILSFQGERIPRQDDQGARVVLQPAHLQPVVEFDESDALDAINAIRR